MRDIETHSGDFSEYSGNTSFGITGGDTQFPIRGVVSSHQAASESSGQPRQVVSSTNDGSETRSIIPKPPAETKSVGNQEQPDLRSMTDQAVTGRAPDDDSQVPDVPAPPSNWTTLYHGTNLGRTHWQDKEHTLDEETLTVGKGLSVITERDRQRNAEHGQGGNAYNTTEGYAKLGTGGQQVEIRVLYPNHHTRQTGYKEFVRDYAERYGETAAQAILAEGDKTYWMNDKGGRHPLVARGTVLSKLGDQNEGDRRIVTYVPKHLKDIFEAERQRDADSANPKQ